MSPFISKLLLMYVFLLLFKCIENVQMNNQFTLVRLKIPMPQWILVFFTKYETVKKKQKLQAKEEKKFPRILYPFCGGIQCIIVVSMRNNNFEMFSWSSIILN